MELKQTKSEQEELISLAEFKEFMFKQIVPVKDLLDFEGKPIEKQFPFWRRNNLLPFFAKGKHRDFEVSFVQMIWLRILDTLRSISFSISDMEAVAAYFFKDAYFDDLPKKNIEYNKLLLEEKVLKGIITYEEEQLLRNINDYLKDEGLLYVLKFDVNYLSNLIGNCISTSLDAGMMIYQKGKVVQYLGDRLFSHKQVDFDINAPHIRLSIKYYLKEFIEDKELERIVMPHILNDDEKYILRELRNDNISELSIKKSDGEIIRVDIVNDITISGEKARQIKESIGLRNYEEVIISTRDANTLSFKKRTKKIKGNGK